MYTKPSFLCTSLLYTSYARHMLVSEKQVCYKDPSGLTTCDSNMTIQVDPELGVPVPAKKSRMDAQKRIAAAAATAEELEQYGLDLEPNKEDQDIAAKITVAYADDPEKTSKQVTESRTAELTPASLVLTNNILKEFGQSVVQSATHVRHLVTNKLLLETENPDPKVRLRALELLGKISDVGLFAEKTEVTVTHQTSDELKQKLRQKLEKLVNPPQTHAEPIDVVEISGEVIDVDAEMGLFDDD